MTINKLDCFIEPVNPLVTKGALLYLPIWQVMCALILFRELRMNPGQGYALRRQDLLSIYAASRYFLFFLPRPFPLADLKAVEYRSTISIKVLNS